MEAVIFQWLDKLLGLDRLLELTGEELLNEKAH